MITKNTATDIALAYREIEAGNELLEQVQTQIDKRSYETEDIRDRFGRRVEGLQLGVPSGDRSHTLFNVPWDLAKPVIQAHLAKRQATLESLMIRAQLEIEQRTNKQTETNQPQTRSAVE